MEIIRPTATGDLPEVYLTRLTEADARLTRWVSMSFSRVELGNQGGQVETYRLHTLDLASKRVIPTLLGVVEGGCDHDVCSLMSLNAVAADYAREAGWSSSHAPDVAIQLALGLGEDLGG